MGSQNADTSTASKRRPSRPARGRRAAEPGGPAAGSSGASLYETPGHLVRRLRQVAVSLFVTALRDAGETLTPVQYEALWGIGAHPGIDQATLAGAIAYDRATIGGVVDRLESRGLVRRTVSTNDRRLRLLVLEPAGAELLARAGRPVREAQDAMLAPLAPDERDTFYRLLEKLTTAQNETSRAPLRPVAPSGRSTPA